MYNLAAIQGTPNKNKPHTPLRQIMTTDTRGT